MRAFGMLPDGLLSDTAPEGSDNGALALVDGAGLRAEGAGSWAHVIPSTMLPTTSMGTAYVDTWRGELRVALSNGSILRYTGTSWATVQVLDPEFDGAPSGANNGVAFDAQRGELVLHGSTFGANDTWVFNGQSWRYATSGGPTVHSAVTVYDDNRGQVLVFGGITASYTPSGATWAFDGESWELIATSGPTPRGGASAVFDAQRGEVVLFGGEGASHGYADTWAWDGNTWRQLCDGDTSDCGQEPTYRLSAGLAYDPLRQRVVLFGGGYTPACGGDAMCDDFYEWDGERWWLATPTDAAADGSPGGRTWPVLGWDPLSRRLILAGGEDEFTSCGAVTCSATWAWDGSDWLLLSDPERATPQIRPRAMFALDASAQRIVVQTYNEATDDTWTFDGRLWTRHTTGNPQSRGSPGSSSAPTGIYRFGGLLPSSSNASDELWRRSGTTWTLQAATTKPLSRSNTMLTFLSEATTPYALLFGGSRSSTNPGECPEPDSPTSVCYLGDTWGYGAWGTPTCASAGTTCWRSFGTSGPTRRYDAILVATEGDEAVLFGGRNANGALADTWRWSGNAWEEVAQDGPSARQGHVGAFDARRGKVVVASGASANFAACGALAFGAPCPDVWEWDGTSWRERQLIDRENDGAYAQLSGLGVYWPSEKALYAPDLYGNCSGCLWRWDGAYDKRPAVIAEFDFYAVGAPSDASIERVELEAFASASSHVDGALSTDVTLLRGEALGFREWHTVDASSGTARLYYCAASAPTPSCETRDPRRLLIGARGTTLLGVTPNGINGEDVAQVLLDYAEVRISYRQP